MNSQTMQKLVLISMIFLFTEIKITSAQQWDTLAPIPEEFTFPVVAVVDGKIHIMGGGGTGGATDHHFAYDPATDTWEPAASVPYLAQQPAGAAVNGKIHYFGGGYPNSGTPLDDHYIYDPAIDDWTEAKKLTSPRAIHYGVGMDTILYSIAGQGKASLFQAYTASTDAWISRANLPDIQFWYGAHVEAGGKIYRFCGGGYTVPNKFAHQYDPESNQWSAIKMFPVATHAIKGAVIGDKIFLSGGYHDFLERDEVYVYDIATDSYSTTTPMPIGRSYHNMVAIDSCLYVLGGNNAIDESVKTQLIRLCPFENTTAIHETTSRQLHLSCQDGILCVEIDEPVSTQTTLMLFNSMGQETVLINSKGNGGQLTFDVGDVPGGLYFVRMNSGNHIYTGKLFIP